MKLISVFFAAIISVVAGPGNAAFAQWTNVSALTTNTAYVDGQCSLRLKHTASSTALGTNEFFFFLNSLSDKTPAGGTRTQYLRFSLHYNELEELNANQSLFSKDDWTKIQDSFASDAAYSGTLMVAIAGSIPKLSLQLPHANVAIAPSTYNVLNDGAFLLQKNCAAAASGGSGGRAGKGRKSIRR